MIDRFLRGYYGECVNSFSPRIQFYPQIAWKERNVREIELDAGGDWR